MVFLKDGSMVSDKIVVSSKWLSTSVLMTHSVGNHSSPPGKRIRVFARMKMTLTVLP